MSADFGAVRRLFDAALDVAPEQRAAWLAAHCDDPALRAEVADLLRRDADTAQPLTGLAQAHLPQFGAAAMIGQRIGAYRVEALLGEGGMGLVFAAQQERPQRRVALKVLRTALPGAAARRRFEHEAEILAQLQHPGIAHVYEAGVFQTASGEQPYFAMELIADAVPLDRHVREHQLRGARLLRLFEQICEAVHHAHQRGVTHRDLKPANVLVDGSGHARLIDFGIAGFDVDAWRQTVTAGSGEVLGTLAYMSPEQLLGGADARDTRVDVYALGVVLFELTTGRLPFGDGGGGLSAITDRIRSAAPPRPSQVGPPGLSIELDWIVLRAMAKEPAQRYGSAAELAAEVARLRRGEPVLAGPPSTAYRLRKFVGRHRLATFGSLALLASLVAGTIATTIGWQHAIAAEHTAEQRRAEAIRLADDLWNVTQLQYEMLGGVRGDRTVRLADVIDRARQGLERRDLPGSVAGAMHLALAISYASLGDNGRAAQQYDAAAAAVDPEHMPRLALAIDTNRALLLQQTGKTQDAEALLRGAVERHVALYGEGHETTAKTRANHAALLTELGRLDDAAAAYERALPALERALGPGDAATIVARTGRAHLLQLQQRADEAAREFAAAADLAERHLGADDPQTLSTRNTQAAFLIDTGHYDEARPLLQALAAARARISGPAHPSTLRVWNNLAICDERQGRYADAVATHRRVLAARQAAGGGKELFDLITRFNLGAALHQQAEDAPRQEAVAVLRDLVRDAGATLPAEDWRLATFRQHLGIALRKTGAFDEAEAQLTAARGVLERTLGAAHERTQSNWRETAALYEAWGKPDLAAEYRRKLSSDK